MTSSVADLDPELWTVEPPCLPESTPANDPLDDPVFSAELTLEIAHRMLQDRTARLDRARDICRRAHEALQQAVDEVKEACKLVADAAYAVAERRGHR
jgi:hypothetical protein